MSGYSELHIIYDTLYSSMRGKKLEIRSRLQEGFEETTRKKSVNREAKPKFGRNASQLNEHTRNPNT